MAKHHKGGMGKAHHGHKAQHGPGGKDPHAHSSHHEMNKEHDMEEGCGGPNCEHDEGDGEDTIGLTGGNQEHYEG